MLEVRNKLLDGIHHFGLGEIFLSKDSFQATEEGIDLRHGTAGGFFHYAEGLESAHINLFAGDVEFFVGLFTGGVALEIDYRVGVAVIIHLCGEMLGIGVGGTFLLAEALGLYEVIADAAEGEHLVFAQLGEEDFPAPPEDASQHTDLTGFFGADEVPLHVTRRCQGLFLLKPMQPAIRKRPIAESDVGKAGGGHFESAVISHHQILHDALARAHYIDGIRRLVRAHTEKMLRWELAEEVHQLLRLDVVVLDERLHAVAVFFAADVLVGGEVGHDVEALFLAEDAFEDGIGKIQRVAAELVRDIEPVRAAHVAHQLRQAVLVKVNHDDLSGFKSEDRLDKTGADASGAADNADRLALDLFG